MNIVFSKSHLWIRKALSEDHACDIGVTKYLVKYLGDIVHLEYPKHSVQYAIRDGSSIQ